MAEDWRVVSQRQTEQLNPSGSGFETVVEVTYSVTSGPARGTSGKVVVPQSQYNAATVQEMIQAAVDAHHEVAAL
jgi:hypothetical protein